MKSKSYLHPSIRSLISFSFNAGKRTAVPGKFIVFLLPNPFPCTTVQTISFPTISSTTVSYAHLTLPTN